MEATQETTQETPLTSTTESESKKIEHQSPPKLSSEELLHKVVSEIKQCFTRSEKSYQAYHVQNIFKRTNYRFLSDLHFHCLVIEVQTLFKGNATIPQQMTVMRVYHEMIVLLERARTYIAGVLPIMFVETMSNVKDENMFYFMKELKAFYRIWHGYMDNPFLRKVRDQCNFSCGVNLMQINLTDKYIAKELSRIKHSPLVAQRIITGHTDGVFPNGANAFQTKPTFKPRFNSWKKRNNPNKEETISRQSNGFCEQKEKSENFASDLNQMPKSQESGQPRTIQTIKQVEIVKEVKQTEPCTSSHTSQLQIKEKASEIKSPEKSLQSNQSKEDKVNKLKSMYELMLSKKRKTGNKLLVQSGSWQCSESIIQALKEKTFKNEITQMVDAQRDLQDEQWVYPEHMFTSTQPEEKPFLFECKFCGSKLHSLRQNGEDYFRDIVFFEMRSGLKRHKQEVPFFQLKNGVKTNEGVFLLHRECFQAVYQGKIDDKKWKLE